MLQAYVSLVVGIVAMWYGAVYGIVELYGFGAAAVMYAVVSFVYEVHVRIYEGDVRISVAGALLFVLYSVMMWPALSVTLTMVVYAVTGDWRSAVEVLYRTANPAVGFVASFAVMTVLRLIMIKGPAQKIKMLGKEKEERIYW